MKNIPVYSIDQFKSKPNPYKHFQVEPFDADRHFDVAYPHRHDFYEILFLTKGSGTHVVDFIEYPIKPNSLFFLSPGQIHSIDLSQDVEGFIFLFTGEFFLLNKHNSNRLLEFPFFFHLGKDNPPLLLKHSEDIELLKNLFELGCQEMDAQEGNTEEVIISLLDLILLRCERLYPQAQDTSTRTADLLIKRFKLALEENYHKNLSIGEYAEILAVTANHLTDTIKKTTGRTSSDILNDKITLEIKRLLLFTDLTATQIAEELNFKDQSYFTRYFKRLTGLTPMDFRKKSMKST